MRRQLVVATLAVPFAAIVALRAAPARACSCVAPRIVPSNDSTGIPLNTRVWVPDYRGVSDTRQPRLWQDSGQPIDVDVGTIQDASGMRFLVLTPKAPLAPSTKHMIEAVEFGKATTIRFTTGDAADTTAPALPAGKLTKVCAALTPGSSCGEQHRLLQFEIPTYDTPLAVITAGEQPPPLSLTQSPPSWPPDPNPVLFSYATHANSRYETWLGQGGCSFWPSSQAAGTIFYGAVDLAGNFSGWRAGGVVGLPDYPKVAVASSDNRCVDPSAPPPDGGVTPPGATSGCAIGGRDASALPVALLAALALIGLGRRRPGEY
jgi:hypothetical protein